MRRENVKGDNKGVRRKMKGQTAKEENKKG